MSVIPFTYADQPVRVVEIDGEPWFVAAHTVRITAKGAVALAVMLNVAPADLAEALTTLDEEAAS